MNDTQAVIFGLEVCNPRNIKNTKLAAVGAMGPNFKKNAISVKMDADEFASQFPDKYRQLREAGLKGCAPGNNLSFVIFPAK